MHNRFCVDRTMDRESFVIESRETHCNVIALRSDFNNDTHAHRIAILLELLPYVSGDELGQCRNVASLAQLICDRAHEDHEGR